jgi:FtsP/CotA-like multicopper oxidase with cupredoxin domain
MCAWRPPTARTYLRDFYQNAQVGRIERWRLVHAGVRDTIKLQFRKMRPGAAPFALQAAAAQDEWITQNCPGAPLSQFAVATDGLTRSQAIERPVTVLQPGYREDLLMVFPEALQQIQYACRDANGRIKTDSSTGAWVCAPGDVGGIEGYDPFGPPTWQRSGRYTSINGQGLPTFSDAQVGRIERWRLVHAGVRDTIKLDAARRSSLRAAGGSRAG